MMEKQDVMWIFPLQVIFKKFIDTLSCYLCLKKFNLHELNFRELVTFKHMVSKL